MRVKVKSSRAPGALARGGPNRLIYCCLFDRPRLALSRPPGEIVGPEVDRDRGEAHHDADPEDRRVMDRPSLLRWLHAFSLAFPEIGRRQKGKLVAFIAQLELILAAGLARNAVDARRGRTVAAQRDHL